MSGRPLYKGYLEKQGGFIKNFKKRFMVLSSTSLRYYNDEQCYRDSPEKTVGAIELGKLRVSLDIPAKYGKQYGITLVPSENTNRVYYLVASSAAFQAEWINQLSSLAAKSDNSKRKSVQMLKTRVGKVSIDMKSGEVLPLLDAVAQAGQKVRVIDKSSFENLSHQVPLLITQVQAGLEALKSFQKLMIQIGAGCAASAEAFKKAMVSSNEDSLKDGMESYNHFLSATVQNYRVIALKQEQYADALQKRIVVPMKTFLSVAQQQYQGVCQEYKSALQDIATLKASFVKKRKEAMKVHSAFQECQTKLNKSTTTKSKTAQRLKLASQYEKLKTSFKAYQFELLNANKKIARFYNDDLPFIISKLQLLEKTRLTELESYVQVYAQLTTGLQLEPVAQHTAMVNSFASSTVLYRDDNQLKWLEEQLNNQGYPSQSYEERLLYDLPNIKPPHARSDLDVVETKSKAYFHHMQFAESTRAQIRQKSTIAILKGEGGTLALRKDLGNWDNFEFKLEGGYLKGYIRNKLRGKIAISGAVLRNFGESDFGRRHCFGVATKLDFGMVRQRRATNLRSVTGAAPTSVSNWNVVIVSAKTENAKVNWLAFLSQHIQPRYDQISLMNQASINYAWTLISSVTPAQWQLVAYLNNWAAFDFAEPLDILNALPTNELNAAADALIHIATLVGSTFTINLLRAAILYEVDRTHDEAQLFRVNSLASKLLSYFVNLIGEQYLFSMLQEAVVGILVHTEDTNYELSPVKLPKEAKGNEEALLEEAAESLTLAGRQIMDRVMTSLNYAPHALRAVTFCLNELVYAKFPNAKASMATSGFLFLRWICPAIMNARSWAVDRVDAKGSRALLLLVKMLQKLANGAKFGANEQYLQVLNKFLDANTEQFNDFCNQFARFPAHLLSDPSLSFRDSLSAENCYVVNDSCSSRSSPSKDSSSLTATGLPPVPEELDDGDFSVGSLDIPPSVPTSAPDDLDLLAFDHLSIGEAPGESKMLQHSSDQTFPLYPGLVVDSSKSVAERATEYADKWELLRTVFEKTNMQS